VFVASEQKRVVASLTTPKHCSHTGHEMISSISGHLEERSRLAMLVWIVREPRIPMEVIQEVLENKIASHLSLNIPPAFP
jgi:hypothetical protein